MSAKQIAKRKVLRAELIAKLGGVCVRCGFSDERALQFDHINGDGHKEGNRGYSYIRLRNMLNDPNLFDRYQLLCANCNWIKREENKEYRFKYSHTS